MAIAPPTMQQMREIVSDLRMSMSDNDIAEYITQMRAVFLNYNIVNDLPDEKPTAAYPRTPGYRPSAEENSCNAWYVKTDIKGASTGKLAGKNVVLKDTICLAGVPMMNGAAFLEGYVPDIDATVVTRILDAGGTITGKAHCELLSCSAGSHTNAAGPVHNPHKHGFSAGGSSSGCAALVAAGEVDMAVGGDQGGSIRTPSAFCGAYGMKPTHGLVPYTGIMAIESTIDHAGPITASVADNALLLEVIAGEDGLDPRQYTPIVRPYTEALDRGAGGLRIGIVKQGFGMANSEGDVDEKVMNAGEQLRKIGSEVENIDLPMHDIGDAIWSPIGHEGLQVQMIHGNGFGFNQKGFYSASLLNAQALWRDHANELSPSLKLLMFVGEYFVRHYRGRYYGKAQNLVRRLRAAYDAALDRYDILLMPTLPTKATPLPSEDATISEIIESALGMVHNTCPFNATGHPAMSVPCGVSEGLPVGMMLIGKHYDEPTIYQVASAFEQSVDWRTL